MVALYFMYYNFGRVHQAKLLKSDLRSNHALEPTRLEAVPCNRPGARLSANVGPA